MKIIHVFPLFLLASLFAKTPKGDFQFTMGMLNTAPVLRISTTKTFACSNYGIILRQGWSRDTLTLKIIGIDTRQACNNVPDLARETVEIFGIREKEFTMLFYYENKINSFHVEFDGESFSITPEKFDFIHSVTK